MQGFHQHQQHLVALLSAALPRDASASSATELEESSRLSSLKSLHAAIVYPSNAVLVVHSASFLCHGLAQLLSDKISAIRQLAVKAYGALCSKVCSAHISSNGRQSPFLVTSLVDHFIGWALPLLNSGSTGSEATELALDGLHEFLSIGDASEIGRYVSPILKASQELLEDERTSWSLLHRLLAVLTLIAFKFPNYFQPHFVDIVDLLLGCALLPDLSDQYKSAIMDTFTHFHKHWVSNMSFSIGLLSKFVVDMEMLLQDGSPGIPQKVQRLNALLDCFSRILQSTTSGLLEIHSVAQLYEPLEKMVSQFLGCLSVTRTKIVCSKWTVDCWKCITLLAEILGEKFCKFYPFAVGVLFECLGTAQPHKSGKLSTLKICEVLKINYQLLSLQRLGLLASSVQKVLQFDAPISQLRLHPNHSVTACCAATYVFMLQHAVNEVVKEGISFLHEEIKHLKSILVTHRPQVRRSTDSKTYSKCEVLALIRFDLKVLLSCIPLGEDKSVTIHPESASLYLERTEKLGTLIIEQLYPFDALQSHVELQVDIIKAMKRLSAIEFFSRTVLVKQLNVKGSDFRSDEIASKSMASYGFACMINTHLGKYWKILENSLCNLSPVAVKLEALEWIHGFYIAFIDLQENLGETLDFFEKTIHDEFLGILLPSLISIASDQESKVRLRVASIFEVSLLRRHVPSILFYLLSRIFLERLADPDTDVKNAFTKLLSQILPMAVYAHGLVSCDASTISTFGNCLIRRSPWHWKHVFALKQLPQQLTHQQLVTILSYISQRWMAPFSSWIQRLIHNSRSFKELLLNDHEEKENAYRPLRMNVEHDFLKRVCIVNNLAAVWWAIHEAVRYCVINRLRTNLGGPTQTFSELERLLADVAHLVCLDIEQNDCNLNLLDSSRAHLLPMRLLLEFVEALKKNVYNAYDGSVTLSNTPLPCVLFFRANQKVCEEWFSRMSEQMINAGIAIQCYDATIQYCSLRLQDLKFLADSDKGYHGQFVADDQNSKVKFREDVFKVLQYMALALCKNHDPKALVGLQKWASSSLAFVLVEDNQDLGQGGVLGPFSWITGLVYMAEGHYENASAHFSFLLQNQDALNFMGSEGVQFAIDRIIECFSAVSDWKSLEKWLLELHALRSKHAGKAYSGALTAAGNDLNAIQALAHFDEGDLQAAWASLNLTPKSSNDLTLDPKIALQRSEQILLQAILFQSEGKTDKVLPEIQKAKSMLEEMLSVLPLDGLMDATPFATQLHCIFAFEEGCKLVNDRDMQKQHLSTLSSSYVQVVQFPMNLIFQDCNHWLKILRVYQAIFPGKFFTIKLCQDLMSLSRKQRNFGLANRLHNTMKNHLSKPDHMELHDYFQFHLQYECILLMYAENKIEIAFHELMELVHPFIFSPNNVASDVGVGYLKAKACLKLSKWLRQDYVLLMRSGKSFLKWTKYVIAKDNSFDGTDDVIAGEKSNPQMYLRVVDEIVGCAMKSATHICPTMGKAWISYAHWCHDRAKRSLDNSHVDELIRRSLSSTVDHGSSSDRLTKEELSGVEATILQLFEKRREVAGLKYENEESSVFLGSEKWSQMHVDDIVQNIVSTIQTTAGFCGTEDGECLSSIVASKLRILLKSPLIELDERDIETFLGILLDFWWSLRRRRVSLFGHAACAFMQYFSYSNVSNSQLSGFDTEKAGSCILRAVLYVLNILLTYGTELRDMLQVELSTTPLMPWKEVIPQLFARVSSHPEEVVRKQLEGLLIMLAKSSPWAIVYPTLVDISSYNSLPPVELQNILVYLRKLYPKLIEDVQLMIEEMGSVTVLLEESWLGTFQELHADVARRIKVLKEEADRTEKNPTLSHVEKIRINAAKYSAIMAPIVVSLERRLSTTSKKPETPYEKWFAEEYMDEIRLAISRFKTAPISTTSLEVVWRPFEIIAASLASSPKKSSLLLSEVAPRLSMLSSSDIPMPGFEKQALLSVTGGVVSTSLQGTVKIASFSEQVIVLPTKTKPKKLVIVGSDGEKYTYLLKGREDLRLDARIMQLLQAINGMLCSSIAIRSRCLSIRNYSVTPISGKSGLIQWVDNMTSLYSIFKSWQQRAQFVRMSTLSDVVAKGDVAVPRPSDMFYGKIIPALKESGIKKVISRRDWPHEVKRKVLLDLMEEVPRQLLYQELWCASEGFKGFCSKLKRYSGTVAVMSIVGYVMGLGDRHLDNILIDFSSGDIVHIDYNVCFDKGRRLKVPEVVPFRLTQTLEAALGFTGVEGDFRLDCEGILQLLRKNKDVLLMLLEVFVWDPLVEWTREDFHGDTTIGGEERRGMELAVCLSLFASRVQEIRGPFQEHRDVLLAALQEIDSSLTSFADVLNRYEIVSSVLYRIDQERSGVLMDESSSRSIVTELTSKFEKGCIVHEIQGLEFANAKTALSQMAADAIILTQQHKNNLDALRSGSVMRSMSSELLRFGDEAASLISAVVLADVPPTVVPEPTLTVCRELDKEVSHFIDELVQGHSAALAALEQYSLALRMILPVNYHTTSQLSHWVQVLQLSAGNISSEVISVMRKQAIEFLARVHRDESKMCIYDDLCFEVGKYTNKMEQLRKELSELMNSVGIDAECKAKDHLMSAVSDLMRHLSLSRDEATPLPEQQMEWKDGGNMEFCDEQRKDRMLAILNIGISSMFSAFNYNIRDWALKLATNSRFHNSEQCDFEMRFSGFEEEIEKMTLIFGFVEEVRSWFGNYDGRTDGDSNFFRYLHNRNLVSTIQDGLFACRILGKELIEEVLPDLVNHIISCSSEVVDALGLLSQVRASVDAALEQANSIESERASLVELEMNYFVNVSRITEQKLALEEAAAKGQDDFSWEEAEELASRVEACRSQLDQLHKSWNQRDLQYSSLIEREDAVKDSMLSWEQHLETFPNVAAESDSQTMRSKMLLCLLFKPFSRLESNDKVLSKVGGTVHLFDNKIFSHEDVINLGYTVYRQIWKFSSMLDSYGFFIWKFFFIDSFFDSCLRETSTLIDQSVGFDQLLDAVKKRLGCLLHEYLSQYLVERVAPILVGWLDEKINMVKQFPDDVTGTSHEAVGRLQEILEEYCSAHETAAAARRAAASMGKQIFELSEAIRRNSLEIVRMKWMRDVCFSPSYGNLFLSQKIQPVNDFLSPAVLNLSRHELVENLQSAASKLERSSDGLQACLRTSIPAECQLERAMSRVCGNLKQGVARGVSGEDSCVPQAFHDHLVKRRNILSDYFEKASKIMKTCMCVLQFEALREGIFHVSGGTSVAFDKSRSEWQQIYMNALTRLETAYHSFSFAKEELDIVQTSMEAASAGLSSAENDLCNASVRVNSASGDLGGIGISLKDSANAASLALSAFSGVVKDHKTLTSEFGSTLEEILAISKNLHDMHNLGNEAAVIHSHMMEDLSKASSVVFPLETLCKEVATMAESMRDTRENFEISTLHRHAICKSYAPRIREACLACRPLVSSIDSHLEDFLAMLTKLARTANLHAGNLHKALEGIIGSEEVKSGEVNVFEADLDMNEVMPEYTEAGDISPLNTFVNTQTSPPELCYEERGWLSPPDTISSSPEYTIASGNEGPSHRLVEPSCCSGGTATENIVCKSSSHAEVQRGVSSSTSSIPLSENHCTPEEVGTMVMPERKSEFSCSDRTGVESTVVADSSLDPEVPPYAKRGKNAYAVSALRRVGSKLGGAHIIENRNLSIEEQVDFLLKQATSIDNLCNMYEGWTPWI